MKFQLAVNQKITKELLLSKHSEEEYLEYYLGVPVKKGLFCSPPLIRRDNKPTCSFYKNKNGNVIFKDFAGISGDVFTIVMYLFQCSYYQALRIIANDFNIITIDKLEKHQSLIPYSGNILKTTEKANIQVEIKEFSDKELIYWKNFGISKLTLEKFKVYSIKSVFLNRVYHTSSTEQVPIYGYYGGESSVDEELWRLYFPTKKTYRFLSNWSSSMLQGMKQITKFGESCIIIKSMKDLMLLDEFGFTSVAPTSENILITPLQFKKLSSKFNQILIFFDNDRAGVLCSHKYKKEYNCRCIFIKRKYAKDISDLYKSISNVQFWLVIDELNLILSDNSITNTKHFYIF